jgi:hypothetical protein
VAFDGGVPLIEDGPGVHQRFGGPEKLLHQQQSLVLNRDLGGRQVGVGAQDIFPVESGRSFGLIEAHSVFSDLQEPPETLVVYQALGALVQLVFQRRDSSLPVGRVLGHLLGVVADYVTLPLNPDLLDPEVVRHLPIAAGAAQHKVPHHRLLSEPGPQNIFQSLVFQCLDGVGADHVVIRHPTDLGQP